MLKLWLVAEVRRISFGVVGKPRVSILTPTIAGREAMLEECCVSVAAQTFGDYEHLILLDEDRRGVAVTVNELAGSALGEWLVPFADDDLLLPRFLELLVAAAVGPIVYSPPLVWGEDAAQFRAPPPNIPGAALISADLWRALGGYGLNLSGPEDQDFWRRASTGGHAFILVDEHPTWVYRFWGENLSRSPAPAGSAHPSGITDPGTTLS